MPDKLSYEQSRIDWPRLRAYARRVSEQTSLSQLGPVTYSSPTEQTTYRTETRRSGIFGHRVETIQVPQTIITKQQVEALGPHWPLANRAHNRRETTMDRSRVSAEVEDFANYTYALKPDGGLITLVVVRKVQLYYNAGRVFEHHEEAYHTCEPFSDADVESFDFDHPYYDRTNPLEGSKIQAWGWNNFNPRSSRLLRHAKGVGLTLALKEILEGRLPR